MFQHVTQKTNHDCALAAIAMAVGKTYDEAWTAEDTAKVVEAKGVASIDLWMDKQGLTHYKDWVEMQTYRDDQCNLKFLLKWRRALLSVHSLNNDCGYHMVYWDGTTLHDPSNKSKFIHLHSVHLMRVILLRS